MAILRRGRRQKNKEITSGTFLGRGKNNKGASYRREYIDDGKSQKIILSNIGTNKKFIIPRIPKYYIDGHLTYGDDNLKIAKELSNYDAATDRGFGWKLKGFSLPELYGDDRISLGELDLNNT